MPGASMKKHAEMIRKFKTEIWEHGKFREGRGGMGNYGERFSFHSKRYKMLTEEERRLYETAVLELILDEDPAKAEVGVTISELLLDYRPPNWLKRVASALETILEHALPVEEGDYYDYLPMSLLTRISSLGLKQFAPSLKAYTREITEAVDQEKLSLERWETLYRWVSRGLIQFSCSDAKEVLSELLRQDTLLAQLDEKLDGLLSEFFFYGVSAHGFGCGKELVQIVFSSSNAAVTRRRTRALRSAMGALESWKHLEGQGEAEEFKYWTDKHLDA